MIQIEPLLYPSARTQEERGINRRPGGVTLLQQAESNRAQIFYSSAFIERELEYIIAEHFFPQSIPPTITEGEARGQGITIDEAMAARQRQFEDWILASNWCGFDAKRSLVQLVAKEVQMGDDKWIKNVLEKRLRAVIDCRNAFAHGRFSVEGDEVRHKWFKSGEQSALLTTPHLREIENCFRETWTLCEELRQKAFSHRKPSA